MLVVDVRDQDFDGGNIKGCIHHPSDSFDSSISEVLDCVRIERTAVVSYCKMAARVLTGFLLPQLTGES